MSQVPVQASGVFPFLRILSHPPCCYLAAVPGEFLGILSVYSESHKTRAACVLTLGGGVSCFLAQCLAVAVGTQRWWKSKRRWVRCILWNLQTVEFLYDTLEPRKLSMEPSRNTCGIREKTGSAVVLGQLGDTGHVNLRRE